MTRSENYQTKRKRDHGHCCPNSNSACCYLTFIGTIKKLYDSCPKSEQITFDREQFQLEGNGVKIILNRFHSNRKSKQLISKTSS